MFKRELKKFKDLLLAEKERIRSEINHVTKDAIKKSQKDASGDISGYTFHMADVATDTYDRGFSFDLATNEQKILYTIDEALNRIEDGSYGKCMECKSTISKARLKIVPFAALCIKCQKKREAHRK